MTAISIIVGLLIITGFGFVRNIVSFFARTLFKGIVFLCSISIIGLIMALLGNETCIYIGEFIFKSMFTVMTWIVQAVEGPEVQA